MVDPYFNQIFNFYWPRLDIAHKTFFADHYISLLQSAVIEASCLEPCDAVTNKIDTLNAWIDIATPYLTPPVLP